MIRDASVGDVTNGWTIAGGIALTLAAAAGAAFLPLPAGERDAVRLALLGGQALHAGGHILGLYHAFWWYDDLLHVGLTLALAALGTTYVLRCAPALRSRPWEVAAIAIVIATAAAGAWELFEYAADGIMGTREQDNLADTMQDLADGMLGGILAGGLTVIVARITAANEARRLSSLAAEPMLALRPGGRRS